MHYRDRKQLAILTLREDRDYVTYDEMIHVLTDRPSNAIYIELDGMLYGLITFGRIKRCRDEQNRRVPFNKTFSFVYPEEYWRARQIFRDKKNVNALPVVSEDGRLLGDYVRQDESLVINYMDLLSKDPYVLPGLKDVAKNTVFVQPVLREGTENKEKLFLWWRQRLESEGIHLQVIHHRETRDRCEDTNFFVFVDRDECDGKKIVDHYLYHQKVNKRYLTISDYLVLMRNRSLTCFNEAVLKELQNQGVFVLSYDFIENSSHFLAALDEKIRKRNEQYDVRKGDILPEQLKETFFGELYCDAYKVQVFPLDVSNHRRFGIPYLSDTETELVHIQNGERLTVGQPKTYDRCIFIYGPCIVVGMWVSDQYTISSLLQNELNQAGFSCKVVNYGYPGRYLNVDRLLSGSFRRGDIIILDRQGSSVDNFPLLNLTDALENNNAPPDWFHDNLLHCNHKANQVYAHAIYEELLPVLQQPSGERTPVELDFDNIDRFYLRHYFSDFDPAGHGTIGSIVMNCNPFTFGHRFLIEEALKTVDFLIIFVVEEDASLFSFQERFAMVCQGTSDLEHIMVVPSGPYILSKTTFSEYFQKINDEDLKKNTEDDITLFAEKIAPRLGITYRFVGEEREDKVTNEYNEAMKRILPRYGIQVVEIPRKTNGPSAISASRVRDCLAMDRMDELDELVPPSTKRILFFEFK